MEEQGGMASAVHLIATFASAVGEPLLKLLVASLIARAATTRQSLRQHRQTTIGSTRCLRRLSSKGIPRKRSMQKALPRANGCLI
jgi:hypothetical protein